MRMCVSQPDSPLKTMALPNQLAKAQRMLNKTSAAVLSANGMNSTSITLHWTELTAPGVDYDENDLSTHPASSTPQTLDFKAFVHFVNHGSSTYQRFAEVHTGDVIMDLPAATVIDGKNGPRFAIGGKFYTHKLVGGELAEVWDARTGNSQATFRTILLKPAN